MGKRKSFLQSIEVETAQRAHSCQHNKNHRINNGDIRLSIKVGRSHERYCVECAKESLKADIAKLSEILQQLESIQSDTKKAGGSSADA
ncbi:MAG: hypothetical protein Ta2B_13660 [Termitinemataceae bacterium]|nr:MAG: hypothetical protein Ta2B_13660 [Termitinemataceae bacterium]